MPLLSPPASSLTQLVTLPFGFPRGTQVQLGQVVRMAEIFGSAIDDGRPLDAFLMLGACLDAVKAPHELRSYVSRDLLTGYAIGHPFSNEDFRTALADIAVFRLSNLHEAVLRGYVDPPGLPKNYSERDRLRLWREAILGGGEGGGT